MLGRGSTAIGINIDPHVGINNGGNGFSPSSLTCRTESRLVSRNNGRSNVHRSGLTLKWLGFLTDNFTTLINSPWYMIGGIFLSIYLLSWIIFGGIWLAVAKYEVSHTSNNSSNISNITGNSSIAGDISSNTSVCLEGVTDFSAALLFSIETQVTIGYGNTYVRNNCTGGLFVLVLQCLAGLVIDAFLLGLLFTKITRPRNRRKTILFGERAVIYEAEGEEARGGGGGSGGGGEEDGVHYLEFRIGNLRQSQIAECHVRLMLYWYKDIGAGCSEFQQHELQCGYETGADRLVLLTPVTVRHRIDRSSPLFGLMPSNILTEDLEMVVVLEGVVEATGLTLQALWSYTNEEIILGEKLRPIVARENGRWVVDFSRFNEVIVA